MEPLIFPVVQGHCILSPFYRGSHVSLKSKPSHDARQWQKSDSFLPTPLRSHASPKVVRAPTSPQLASSFLTRLPVEIRLQIYEYIHADHSIVPRDLSPGLPSQPLKPMSLQHTEPSIASPLLPSDRPIAYIPTAVLQTCRQIYHEARTIPFKHNEFAFTASLLCSPYGGGSGLAAACAFADRLAWWQRHSMEWVRLEVCPGAGDLGYKSFGCHGKWAEACGYWGLGLSGLRLKIEGSRIDMDRAGWQWVGDGLKDLRALRWLELVLVSEDRWDFAGGTTRAEWVEELEGKINAGRARDERVAVSCCEEVVNQGRAVRKTRRGKT